MPLLPKTRSSRVLDMLRRLEDQMRSMREDMDSRFDSMAEAFESRHADEEAAALAAERIRSGAADHSEDGAAALAQLGIKLPEG
jgi:hypothetical protein